MRKERLVKVTVKYIVMALVLCLAASIFGMIMENVMIPTDMNLFECLHVFRKVNVLRVVLDNVKAAICAVCAIAAVIEY